MYEWMYLLSVLRVSNKIRTRTRMGKYKTLQTPLKTFCIYPFAFAFAFFSIRTTTTAKTLTHAWTYIGTCCVVVCTRCWLLSSRNCWTEPFRSSVPIHLNRSEAHVRRVWRQAAYQQLPVDLLTLRKMFLKNIRSAYLKKCECERER